MIVAERKKENEINKWNERNRTKEKVKRIKWIERKRTKEREKERERAIESDRKEEKESPYHLQHKRFEHEGESRERNGLAIRKFSHFRLLPSN